MTIKAMPSCDSYMLILVIIGSESNVNLCKRQAKVR